MADTLDHLTRLTLADAPQAAAMFARAFRDDPLLVFLIPPMPEREAKLPIVYRFLVRHAILYGEAYATSPALEGVALWLPSDQVGMRLWPLLRSDGLAAMAVLGVRRLRLQKMMLEFTNRIHRQHAPFPHQYLSTIAVDPPHQGQGHAAALLKPMFARLDRLEIPCYLETLTERAAAIYAHYGFKTVERSSLPGTNIPFWAMLRDAPG